MAITACKECSNEISTTAKACPKCGAVVPRTKIWPWFVGVPLAGLVLLMLYGMTIPEYKIRARQVREVCEDIAMPHQRHICREQYDEAIRKGVAQAAGQ